MKILLVSDLHGQSKALQYLEKILGIYSVDGIIISGDITIYSQEKFFDDLSKIIDDKNVPAFMIWGNSDTDEIRARIAASPYNIQLLAKNLGGYKIVGFGETDEPIGIDSNLINGNILVTHRPPLKAMINQPRANAPRFHISGHIHSAARQIEYPSTTHIQVPSLMLGRFAIFNPDKATTKFYQI
jgi:Icc-related predicted phosphoesterase